MDWFDALWAADSCLSLQGYSCSGVVILFLLLGAAGGYGGYLLGSWLDGQLGTSFMSWLLAVVGAAAGMALAYWIMRRNAESRDWS